MKRILVLGLILFISVAAALAQGEEGGFKTKSVKPSPKSKTQSKKKTSESRTAPKAVQKNAVKPKRKNKTQTAKIVYADLNITVNEPASEIFLANEEGNVFEGQDSALTDENGVLEIGEVPVGNYTLTIRKEGFFSEEKKIYVAGGRVNSVSVVLRPSTAFLSVKSNVSGTNIEVESVGEFENGFENLFIQPGTYRVSFYKKGFVSETRTVSLTAPGQKERLTVDLTPLNPGALLSSAESDLQNGDWSAALRNAKKVLAFEPENASANLLAGLAVFKGANPQSGVYLLRRAVKYGVDVSLNARIFNKEKNDLQLIAGKLTLSRNALQFQTGNRPELNFSIATGAEIELFEKIDDFGITYINLKARGVFNGKNDKRTVRIYPELALVKATRRELQCSPSCRNAEQALYDFINRWLNGNAEPPTDKFSEPMLPAEEFIPAETTGFRLRLPQNWQVLNTANNTIFAASAGGFLRVSNGSQFTHGIEARLLPNPNGINLNQATDAILRGLTQTNSYLQRSAPSTVKTRAGIVSVNTLSGFSPTTQRDEIVTVYTLLTTDGSLFYMSAVTALEEKAEYEASFRRILNSVTFR